MTTTNDIITFSFNRDALRDALRRANTNATRRIARAFDATTSRDVERAIDEHDHACDIDDAIDAHTRNEHDDERIANDIESAIDDHESRHEHIDVDDHNDDDDAHERAIETQCDDAINAHNDDDDAHDVATLRATIESLQHDIDTLRTRDFNAFATQSNNTRVDVDALQRDIATIAHVVRDLCALRFDERDERVIDMNEIVERRERDNTTMYDASRVVTRMNTYVILRIDDDNHVVDCDTCESYDASIMYDVYDANANAYRFTLCDTCARRDERVNVNDVRNA